MPIVIREATKADIPDIAKIHVSGWQGAYGGIVDQDYIDSKTIEERVQFWSDVFEENEHIPYVGLIDNKIAGFVSFGPLRTPPAGTSKIRPLYSAEIYALYLYPEFFRKGLGTALIQKSVEQLMILKHRSLCLWVLKGNKRGCAFYEAMGGQRVGKKMLQMGKTNVKEVCYAWRDIGEILKR